MAGDHRDAGRRGQAVDARGSRCRTGNGGETLRRADEGRNRSMKDGGHCPRRAGSARVARIAFRSLRPLRPLRSLSAGETLRAAQAGAL